MFILEKEKGSDYILLTKNHQNDFNCVKIGSRKELLFAIYLWEDKFIKEAEYGLF